ncbi:MAG: hypothetical protein H6718_29425 [Polyangiaceae bacterium]|nr:hypothetical protein [Polyangiaceae bacterium]
MRTTFACLVSLSLIASGCGGSAPEPAPPPEPAPVAEAKHAEPAPEPEAAAEPEVEEAPAGIPKACADAKAEVCVPPKGFVERLCKGTYMGVALNLFRKGTPFTRGYLTRKTKAWNASGGASASDDYLVFDEEVIILAKRTPPKGGMQVSGMGGYDALRWDGSCVTLAPEELTTKLPPVAKYPTLNWKHLGGKMRDSLRDDAKIDAAYQKRRQECKGASMGTVSKKCEKADAALATAIIEFVKNGGDVGMPEELPE